MSSPLALGVIVCCRDEERVIERRLRNLAVSQWPEARRPHVVLVVDDGSTDETAKLAAEIGASVLPAAVQFERIANSGRPGKSGAISSALARLEGRVDLVVLTDADVVNDPRALLELEQAFRRDSRLGMACGAQTFVRGLLWSGPIEGVSSRDSGSSYDHATAWVRRLESKGGRLFSVHGQLLAWRAGLELTTKRGLAADDLDLMRQVRCRGLRVERIASARFYELRPWTEDLRQAQALRRARAYVQFARTMEAGDVDDPLSRWQWRFYKHVPTALPWIVMSCWFLATIGGLILLWNVSVDPLPVWRQRTGGTALWLLAAQWVGRRLWAAVRVIEEARQLERTASLEDRWSTAR